MHFVKWGSCGYNPISQRRTCQGELTSEIFQIWTLEQCLFFKVYPCDPPYPFPFSGRIYLIFTVRSERLFRFMGQGGSRGYKIKMRTVHHNEKASYEAQIKISIHGLNRMVQRITFTILIILFSPVPMLKACTISCV